MILDDHTLMAMGLGGDNSKVYVYQGGAWKEFPSLAVGRFGMSCGVADDGNGGTVVVAAGGNDGEDRSDVVEIFSLREGQWRTGRGQNHNFAGMVINMSPRLREHTRIRDHAT